MRDLKPKLCINCKHHLFRPRKLVGGDYFCNRLKDMGVSLVTGEHTTLMLNTLCEEERKDAYHDDHEETCGEEAQYFEPKEC